MKQLFAQRVLRVSLVSVLVFSMNYSMQAEASCAKAKVVSAAESCDSIKVSFDLSECGYKSTESDQKPVVSCSGQKATATFMAHDVAYTAKLKRQEGWGENYWEVVGSVKRQSIKKAEKEAASSGDVKPAQKAEQKSEEKKSEAASAPAAATTAPAAPLAGITLSGVFDMYYAYNFNKPGNMSVPSSTAPGLPAGMNNLRYYDLYHNQMALNLAELEVKKNSTEVNFLLDLDFGQTADLNATTGAGTAGQVTDEVSKHIGQAYVTYNPSGAPRLSFDIGKMATHIGLETIKAKDNYQYSRSILFSYGIPLWHTGVHANYVMVTDRLQAGLYVYNGWNSIYDNNSGKSVGAQIKFTPADFVIVYNMLTGPEEPKDNRNMRTVHELNATWNLSSVVFLGFDALYGSEKNAPLPTGEVGDAKWYAVTLAPKFQFCPKYYLSPRAEFYRDQNGFTLGGEPQTVKSYTLTNSFLLADGLEARQEFRLDHSNSNKTFVGNNRTLVDQFTGLVSLLYSF